METKTKSPEISRATITLNSLIKINNDRYEGYKTASEETQDSELRSLFTKFSAQSKGYAEELKKFVPNGKTTGYDEDIVTGKTQRVWADITSAAGSKDKQAVLNSFEYGEDTALKTYDTILEQAEHVHPEALNAIKKHRLELKKGYDTVRSLKENYKSRF